MKPESCPQRSLLIRFLGETLRVPEHRLGYTRPETGLAPDRSPRRKKKALYIEENVKAKKCSEGADFVMRQGGGIDILENTTIM
jgi:hypothetical protein